MKYTPITELDFDILKSEIIEFIKLNPTFSDYNFEGSALNTIIDILAYNTFQNSFTANMLHAEGFLDSAQRRASIVSRAKELGYVPKSQHCATAYIDVTVVGASTHGSLLALLRGDTFSSFNENGSYSFLVAEDTVATIVGADQKFLNIPVMNGKRVSNYFKVDTTSNIRSIFDIPNKDIDINTLKVYVRPTVSSLERTEYIRVSDIFSVTPDSNVYYIQEGIDGFYQIFFGGDVIGKQPVNNNAIDVDYFIVDGLDEANGCRSFVYDGIIGGFSNIQTITNQVAFGGSDREQNESIKFNAVKTNSSKNRSVTVDDYEATLIDKFPFIKSLSVWGGEDNIPPVYGKVFVSVQPVDGYVISDYTKTTVIAPEIRKTSMLTITPEIVDPSYVTLEFITRVKYNSSKSADNLYSIEGQIKTYIRNYIDSMSTFKSDLLHSDLVNQLTALNPGISSVSMSKNVGFKVSPTLGSNVTYIKNINNSVLGGTIKSTKFQILVDDVPSVVTIKEIPGAIEDQTSTSGIVSQIQQLGVYSIENNLIKNIGYVNLTSGTFHLVLNIFSYVSSNLASRFVNITCKLVYEDVITARNQIMVLENEPADPSIGLVDNNQVYIELYGK